MSYDLDYTGVPDWSPRTLRDKFNDFFEDLTGYEPDDHPDKQYVEDMQDAFIAGAETNE